MLNEDVVTTSVLEHEHMFTLLVVASLNTSDKTKHFN